MSASAVVPEELLFQGSVEVLVANKDTNMQEWGRRYLCVWCNPPCFALFVSDLAAKRAPDFYVSLPPNSEWHEDTDFQGAPPGTTFRLEAQVSRGAVWGRGNLAARVRGQFCRRSVTPRLAAACAVALCLYRRPRFVSQGRCSVPCHAYG